MGARPGGATVAAAALVLVLALAAAAFAGSKPALEDRHPVSVGAAATGDLRIADSRGERAILSDRALAPGGSVVGVLTIENLGAAAHLTLSRRRLAEVPGPGGASLAAALRLRIRDLSADSRAIVYRGGLMAMPPLRLGLLEPGAERRYRFAASLAEPGFVDDSLMGARVSFDYRWRLRRQEAPAGEEERQAKGG
jgi:hypothetical protein